MWGEKDMHLYIRSGNGWRLRGALFVREVLVQVGTKVEDWIGSGIVTSKP